MRTTPKRLVLLMLVANCFCGHTPETSPQRSTASTRSPIVCPAGTRARASRYAGHMIPVFIGHGARFAWDLDSDVLAGNGVDRWCDPHGPFLLSDRQGRLRRRGAFNRRGNGIGYWTEWYSNAKVKSHGKYSDGERHGVWKTWYASGTQASEEGWLGGERYGYQRRWHRNGQLAEEAWCRGDDCDDDDVECGQDPCQPSRFWSETGAPLSK